MKASFFAESRDSILIKNDSTLGFILKYDLYDMIYECSFFFYANATTFLNEHFNCKHFDKIQLLFTFFLEVGQLPI